MYNGNTPVVSVVMCVYNGERFIKEAVDSILNQKFGDFEFIIVNDGSTDRTEEILLSIHDSRIVYVKNIVNLRLIKSLNKGVELAKGRFIARMDADDISLPDRLGKQLEIFKLHPSVDIVNASSYILSENGGRYREQKSATFTPTTESIRFLIHLQNFICHPAVMVKTELLKNYKYMDDESTEHIEDYDLWLRMLNDGCICYTLEDKVILYRDNGSSINHSYRPQQVERLLSLSSKSLVQNFNFSLAPNELRTLLNEGGNVSRKEILNINNKLASYSKLLKSNFEISSNCYQQIETWRKQKVILIALKSLNFVNMRGKLDILQFLMSRIAWTSNKNVRIMLTRVFYIKSYSRSFAAS